jgi:D-alanyl-D-alanine carboxypeptidase
MGPCEVRASALQALADKARMDSGAPGLVLTLDDRSACGIWSGASGTQSGVAIKPNDVLRVGSITKTYVASTILSLAHDQKLGLDDPLSMYSPSFPNAAAITVRQLLNHTSGIFNYTDDPNWQAQLAADPGHVWTPDELVAFAAAQPPYFAPGMGWTYSNTDYILLGQIAEQAGGAPIQTQIRSRFLGPLSLDLTSLGGAEPTKGHLAHGYDGFADVTTEFDMSSAWAAGAMQASAGDLVTWAEALYGGDALDPSSLSEMLMGVPTDEPGLEYGLGVMIMDASVAGDLAYGHSGSIFGYQSNVVYWPNERYAVGLVVNSDTADANTPMVDVIEYLLTSN